MTQSKSRIVAVLAVINVVLLVGLASRHASLPVAQAQPMQRGSYISATAIVSGQGFEALWMLDLSSRRLHAFAVRNASTRELTYLGGRDLVEDFK